MSISVVTRRLFVATRRAAAAPHAATRRRVRRISPRDNLFESDVKKIVISGLKIVLKNIRNVLYTSFSWVELIFSFKPSEFVKSFFKKQDFDDVSPNYQLTRRIWTSQSHNPAAPRRVAARGAA